MLPHEDEQPGWTFLVRGRTSWDPINPGFPLTLAGPGNNLDYLARVLSLQPVCDSRLGRARSCCDWTPTAPSRFCDGLTRRDFLHAGVAGHARPDAAGLHGPEGSRGGRRTATSTASCCSWSAAPATSTPGTPSPNAPAEVRGPFKPIATNVPGMQISEIFPQDGQARRQVLADPLVYHTATAVHDTGHQMMQTGRLFTGGIEHPHVGCVLGYLKGAARRGAGPRAAAPADRPHRRQPAARPDGRLSRQAARSVHPQRRPVRRRSFKVPDLLPPEYISAVRAERRQKLRDAVDGALAALREPAPQAKQLDDNFDLAYRLMSSPQAREAFALDKEPATMRDRYGRTRFGQSCLLARRLIERGVRFVTVNMFETVFDEITWDIHGSRPFTDIAEMSKLVAPNFDQAYQHAAGGPEGPRPAARRRW